MITRNVSPLPVRALVLAWEALGQSQSGPDEHNLKVFVDGDRWIEEWFEEDFVTFVGDRRNADLCVRATPVPAPGKARHYRVHFVGAGRFEFIDASAGLRIDGPTTMFPRRIPAFAGSKTRAQVEVAP